MKRTLLAGACALALIIGGCANTGSTTVNLASAQAQANAAVADINAVGLNLVAQNAITAATFAQVMQGVSAADTAFQAVQNGTQTNVQLAANVANALRTGLAAMGPQVPADAVAVINAAVAGIEAYAASIGAAPAA